MSPAIIDALKARATELGGQIRNIKQGGASSSSKEGSLEALQTELKDTKAKLAQAEKDAKAELEKHKMVLKVPKVCWGMSPDLSFEIVDDKLTCCVSARAVAAPLIGYQRPSS